MEKAAIITQTLLSGGAEKQSVYLAKVLSKTFQVYLIVLKGDRIEQKLINIIESENVEFVFLKGGLLKNLIDIYKIFKKRRIDFVFSYLASGNFFNGVVGLIAGVPYRIGGIRNAELSPNKVPFERLFHNHFLTHTISNSYSAVAHLKTLGFNENKFYVIHNAFDLKESFVSKNDNEVIHILSVSRFVAQKDCYTALKAVKSLVSRMHNSKYKFVYYLIGYGAQEMNIRNWINELDIAQYVFLIIKPENLISYFKKADIFLSTSLFEGMSNSVMEALSFSLPVVSTPAGDMGFLIKNGVNGFLCEFRDHEIIAEQLFCLINDYELRSKMSLNSFLLLSKNFTMSKFEKRYLSFINTITND